MNGPLNRTGRLLRWFVRPLAGQEPSFYRAVTACLLAAGLFWQMNALNKAYTTRLSCPLVWHYDSVHYISLRPLPTAVPVSVSGQGWRLLRANMGWGLHPAELHPVPLPGTRYLPPDAWHRSLQNALEGLQVNDWAGDTLRLTFDRYASRRLTLVPSPDSATRRYVTHFIPSAVNFRGPATIIDALPDPYPVPVPADADDTEALVAVPARVRPSTARVRLQRQLRPASRRRPSPSSN